MIELRINGEALELYGDEKIAQDFSIFKLDEYVDPENNGSRDGGVSNTFSGPKTNTNRRLLGHPDNINMINQDSDPYTRIPCEMWEDGFMIKKGVLEIVSCGEDFEFTFYSDNSNWFSLIKGNHIRDLDYKELEHTFNVGNVYNSKANTSGYVYPVINYGAFTTRTRNGSSDVALTEVYLAVFVHTIIKKMFTNIGYKIAGSFLDSVVYNKLILPFVNEVFGHDEAFINARSAKVYKTVSESFSFTPGSSANPVKFENDSTGEAFDGDGTIDNYNTTLWRYTANQNLRITVIAVLNLENFTGSGGTFVKVWVNGVPNATITTISSGGVKNGSAIINVNSGDYLDIGFNTTSGTFSFDVAAGSSLHFKVEPDIQPGSTVQIAPNLPDLKQEELLKDIFNRYCILTYTDELTKTVYFEDFGILYRNIPIAKDWSSKIDITDEPVIEYRAGEYGQKNMFIHTEDDDEAEIETYNNLNIIKYGDGAVNFDNEFLDPEVEVYESPFSPSICANAFTGGTDEKLYLPYINKPSGEDAEPRIMIYYGLASVPVVSGGTLSTLFYVYDADPTIPWAYFVKKDLGDSTFDAFREGLAFNTPNDDSSTTGLLDKYFAPLKRVIEKPKLLKIKLWLKPKDIIELNHTIPVYLDRYKAYFYINNISEYTGGEETTEVELFKL